MRTGGQKTGARVPRKRGIGVASAVRDRSNLKDVHRNHRICKVFRHGTKRSGEKYGLAPSRTNTRRSPGVMRTPPIGRPSTTSLRDLNGLPSSSSRRMSFLACVTRMTRFISKPRPLAMRRSSPGTAGTLPSPTTGRWTYSPRRHSWAEQSKSEHRLHRPRLSAGATGGGFARIADSCGVSISSELPGVTLLRCGYRSTVRSDPGFFEIRWSTESRKTRWTAASLGTMRPLAFSFQDPADISRTSSGPLAARIGRSSAAIVESNHQAGLVVEADHVAGPKPRCGSARCSPRCRYVESRSVTCRRPSGSSSSLA